jgi:hypothetical protein
MWLQGKAALGTLDILVNNARVELARGFYQSPLKIL